MSTIDNLNSIYTSKISIKTVLGTESDDFTYYGTYVTNNITTSYNNGYASGYATGYDIGYADGQAAAVPAAAKEYLTIEPRDSAITVTVTKGYYDEAKTIYYSKDKITWNSKTLRKNNSESLSVQLATNEKLYFYSIGSWVASSSETYAINANNGFNVSGNPMSLVFGQNFVGQTSLAGYDRALRNLFAGSRVVDASNMVLPATTLSNGCYTKMFLNCTMLTNAPKKISGVQSALSTDSDHFFSMFEGCTSLTTAPEIMLETIYGYTCQNMFKDCTSLVKSPVLKCKVLASGCYMGMFNGCTSLNEITCLATDVPATSYVSNWTNGVAATGTFYKDPNITSWTTGASGIPSGWTVVDYIAA